MSLLDLINLHVPTYQITTSKVPIAFIFTAGKQMKIIKVPDNQKFFIHKDYGLFELKQEFVFFINKTPVYFFDTRNQNPLNMPLMDELYKWANKNQLSIIKRENIKDGIKLRLFGNKENVTKDKKEKIKIVNEKISKIREKALQHNKDRKKLGDDSIEGIDSEEEEITEDEITFSIIKLLVKYKIIDMEKALQFQKKLASGELEINVFLEELKEFEKITINQPLEQRLDMVLQDFHTYNPKEIMGVISYVTKIDKGLKHLRTKPLRNWFPPAYILFTVLGVMMLLMFVGDVNFSELIDLSETP